MVGNITLQPINWRIVYTPQIPIIEQLVNGTSELLNLHSGLGVNSSAELVKALVTQHLFVGLEFHNKEVKPNKNVLPRICFYNKEYYHIHSSYQIQQFYQNNLNIPYGSLAN